MLSDDPVNIDDLEFPNSMLKELVENLLDANFRVYVFQDKRITQIFYEDEHGRIGSSSDRYGFLTYDSVHKPDKYAGTGYGLIQDSTSTDVQSAKTACETTLPPWGYGRGGNVIKWRNFKHKAESCKVLNYKEIIRRF